MLDAYGIPTPDGEIVDSPERAREVAEGVDGDVVMKIVSPDILHKSDIGGVAVGVADVDEPVRGKLKIVTGYGSNTTYVDVRVDPSPETPNRSVAVDEELSAPPERTPEPPARQRAVNALDRLVQRGGVAGAVFGLVAVGVAVGVAMAVDSAVVWLAVGIALMVAFGAALLSVT
ncbi:hypothetical protein DJ68_06280 [Halorubrum sp. C3]|nr:hypothetical protein DJ68_06280 [Halorubrum sp. C3]